MFINNENPIKAARVVPFAFALDEQQNFFGDSGYEFLFPLPIVHDVYHILPNLTDYQENKQNHRENPFHTSSELLLKFYTGMPVRKNTPWKSHLDKACFE